MNKSNHNMQPTVKQSNETPYCEQKDEGVQIWQGPRHNARLVYCHDWLIKGFQATISNEMCVFYQTAQDEEDHEQAAQGGFRINVSISDRGHGNHE